MNAHIAHSWRAVATTSKAYYERLVGDVACNHRGSAMEKEMAHAVTLTSAHQGESAALPPTRTSLLKRARADSARQHAETKRATKQATTSLATTSSGAGAVQQSGDDDDDGL